MGKRFQFLRALLIAGIAVAATVDQCRAQDVCQDARVTASDPGVFESFGSSVAVSGATALIGADWDRELGTEAGAVYVFGREGTGWVELQKLLGSDQVAGDQFGHSVAIHGSVAMIGSIQHIHPGAPGTGAVYAFRFDSEASVWTEEQEVLTAKGTWGDAFGQVVSLSNDLMLVGASFDDDNGPNAGAAYVFRYDPNTSQWVEEQKLLASDGTEGDFFGISVGISGDLALVGADGHDDGAESTGAAYLFRYDTRTSEWVEEQKLLASDGTELDRFGDSLSISGDVALIGARLDVSGSAYVFRYDADRALWTEQQKLVPSDGPGSYQFGHATAIDGDRAVIGAWSWSSVPGGPSTGAAYVFRFDPEASAWIEQAQLFPQPNAWTNFFGRSVAIDGDTAVIGAIGEDQQRGAAYMFDLAPNCNCPQDLDANGSVGAADLLALLVSWGPCQGCPADFDGNGSVGASDLLVLLVNWGPCP